MRYITDTKVTELGLADVEPRVRRRMLTAAESIYGHLTENPWVTDGTLRAWAAGESIDVDTLNAALRLLVDQDRIVGVGPAPPGGAPDDPPPLPVVLPDPPPVDPSATTSP